VKRTNKILVTAGLLVLLMLVVNGCQGVWLNAEYSDLLDRTTIVSQQIATRANANELSAEEMKHALASQAETWKLFQDARDGKGGDE